MLEMKELVFYCGVIGSGKDYQSKKKVEDRYIQLNFADPLRNIAWSIFKYTPEDDYNYELFKGCAISGWKFKVTGREVLQYLGEILKVEFSDPFIFAKLFVKKLEQYNSKEDVKIVCSDLRFIHEYYEVEKFVEQNKDWKTTYIFCDYKSNRYTAYDQHSSEDLARYFIRCGLKDLDNIPKIVFDEYSTTK